MSSKLQLDMRIAQPQSGEAPSGDAYEVEAGIGVIAGNTVWSMPERLKCEVCDLLSRLIFRLTVF